jgi:hypothetical protein
MGGSVMGRPKGAAPRRFVAWEARRRDGLARLSHGAMFGQNPRRYQSFPLDTYACQIAIGEGLGVRVYPPNAAISC